MAIRLASVVMGVVSELRYEPTQKWIRASLSGRVVVDSRRAVLLWEPDRLVPSYAVSAEDVLAELMPAASPIDAPASPVTLESGGPMLLDPRTGFRHHTTSGMEVTLRADGVVREAAAFRLDDPDLDGYVALDFDAFDTWLEEEEENVAHPRDPFHRVDIRVSSRHVRIEVDGRLLADTVRPRLLFETHLPVRTYMPREDVRLELLTPSPSTTMCAYKGRATYLSSASGSDPSSGRNIAWSYEDPLPDAAQLRGLVCFFDERVDVTVDGELRERPHSPWS